jgi:transposase
MTFYGLDVHKDFIQVCALSPDGRQREDTRIGADEEALQAFGARLGWDDQVILEATFHTWAIHSILRRHVETVVVANPLEVKAIAHARIKTDKVDAYTLAQLLRADFVPAVQMPDEKAWALRQLVSHRRLLVKHRTAVKNSIHALLNRRLIRFSGSDVFGRRGRSWLRALRLSPHERFMLDNALELLDQLAARLGAVDAKLVEFASVEEQVKLLMTVPGLHVTVAVGLIAAIGDIDRFDRPEKLAAYFGLVPRVSQSAGRCHHGRITKAGNSNARHLAIEAAQILARSSAPLAASYHRIRRKKGHNIAVTALARKLVVLVWYMLTKNEPYRYAPVDRTRQKLRTLRPTQPRTRSECMPITLAAVYQEAGIYPPPPAKEGERRAAARNRATISRMKRTTPKRSAAHFPTPTGG